MAVVVVEEEEAWRVLGVEVYSQLLAPISTLKSTGIPSSRSVAAKRSSGTVVAAPRARERVTLTDRHMCDVGLCRYGEWTSLKPSLAPHMAVGDDVLVVGCGNSALSANM